MADIVDLLQYKKEKEGEEILCLTLEQILIDREFLDLHNLLIDYEEQQCEVVFLLVFNYEKELFEVFFKGMTEDDSHIFYLRCQGWANNYTDKARRQTLISLIVEAYKDYPGCEVYEIEREEVD